MLMFAAVCQLGRRLMAGTLTPEASTERTIIVADLIVSTQSSNDSILNTLVGQYLERGINHGKKFYQKIEKFEATGKGKPARSVLAVFGAPRQFRKPPQVEKPETEDVENLGFVAPGVDLEDY